jgi:chorismate--pyruvate lyase
MDAQDYRTMLLRMVWQSETDLLPPPVAEWLFHPDSLTEKLKQHCANLAVAIVSEGWLKNEWLREVRLHCEKYDWIFAQTTLPRQTIENVAMEIPTLGTTPIGLWLFPQNPVRQSLEWAQDPISGLYARRSTLLLHGYPLEITELFLENFDFQGKNPVYN